MDSNEISQAVADALRDGTPIPAQVRERISSVRHEEETPGSPSAVVVRLRDGAEFIITTTQTDDGKAWK
ncbi:MAG: hypothetical protein LC800_20690 [Acidobacteria bacterium]|nr:hypothetical protein [Acidobacteriota bacterium]